MSATEVLTSIAVLWNSGFLPNSDFCVESFRLPLKTEDSLSEIGIDNIHENKYVYLLYNLRSLVQ